MVGFIMVRKRRIWFPGAAYHITCRGNHRNDIFKDEEDFLVYLTILEAAKHEYPFVLIAYCLMTNHVHLLIKTKETDTGKIMKKINLSYAIYFNNKFNYVGHLFQGRYFAELIEDDAQMLSTSRYIHLNPIRAKMVSKPSDYEWSSYSMYIGEKVEKHIDSLIILNRFKDKSRKLYKEYVESSLIMDLMEEELDGLSG
jgi:putative transposase